MGWQGINLIVARYGGIAKTLLQVFPNIGLEKLKAQFSCMVLLLYIAVTVTNGLKIGVKLAIERSFLKTMLNSVALIR